MFENLTIGDISTMLIGLAALGTAIAFLSKPIRKIYERLDRLERTVFDINGNPKFPEKTEVDDIKKNTEEIKDAVNTICDAVMALLDSKINGNHEEEIKKAKMQLMEKRGIV